MRCWTNGLAPTSQAPRCSLAPPLWEAALQEVPAQFSDWYPVHCSASVSGARVGMRRTERRRQQVSFMPTIAPIELSHRKGGHRRTREDRGTTNSHWVWSSFGKVGWQLLL